VLQQGLRAPGGSIRRALTTPRRSSKGQRTVVSNNPGRLSNPGTDLTQRRLSASQVDDLVANYRAGGTLRQLSIEFHVHRGTVTAHLDRRGVLRRSNQRKLTDQNVAKVSLLYEAGQSLVAIGRAFGVSAETVRNELNRAGLTIRSRRGEA
jgi:lambda repressor-like predicted transcriptional regulator